MKKASLFLFFCMLKGIFFAQCPNNPDKQWCENNDKKNRFEGVTSHNVSGKLSIVSFTLGSIPKYEFGKNQKLFVQFYANKDYWLHAEQLTGEDGYYMEDKRQKASSDWKTSTFGPWEVDLVLKNYLIQSLDLGVLTKARQGLNGKVLLFPSKILLNTPNEENNNQEYIVAIRSTNNVNNVNLSVYQGEKPDIKQKVYSKQKNDILSGNIWRVSIPLSALKSEGYYFCEIAYKIAGSSELSVESCLFLHKKYKI